MSEVLINEKVGRGREEGRVGSEWEDGIIPIMGGGGGVDLKKKRIKFGFQIECRYTI